MTFDEFFEEATKSPPYPYQRRLATATELAELLRAPTGAGKTAAVVLGWLWRRHFAVPEVQRATPRRLVYCLPMRVLVEQTVREARTWLAALGLDTPVDVLMGGVEMGDWSLHPERSAILIGTQDMLLSRALNRGYAASRFHWPVDFGLLNNDCLWVFDEPQLMGNGVSTSAQLAGLRVALGTFGSCPSLWMSATLEPAWLDTVDYAGRRGGPPLELTEDDYDPTRPLSRRMTAEKTLKASGVAASKDGREVAQRVVEHHVEGTQTLVVLNTVDRAKAVYRAIRKLKAAPGDVLLVHSRFRQSEREELNRRLMQSAGDRIIVATQVVEAGVDLSARTLVTELAPWASLVQRIGRCNRTGGDTPGRVFWVDLDADRQGAPYEAADLAFARERLAELEGHSVSPKALDDFKRDRSITMPFTPTHVLRRRDLLDLFDTAPDLSGNDIDVARFVRGDRDENDVQVFWREVGPIGPGEGESVPGRRELCSVRVGSIQAFLGKENHKGKKSTGYVWDHLDGRWRAIRDPKREVYPGLCLLLPADSGGYSIEAGWDEDSHEPVTPVTVESDRQPEGTGDDPVSCGPEMTVAGHTQHVCDEVDHILKCLGDLPDGWTGQLIRAARWHDAGKAHGAFQRGIRAANPALDPAEHWAKSGTDARLRHGRRYFRHELASGLAALQHMLPFEVAYLIAAHHGKVRLSIRALPDEDQPERAGVLFAHGVHDGDPLPDVDLGGETCAALALDLSPMQLGGGGSWTARALALRDSLGPFRLAYLESLLRAADRRASKAEREGGRA